MLVLHNKDKKPCLQIKNSDLIILPGRGVSWEGVYVYVWTNQQCANNLISIYILFIFLPNYYRF